MTPEREKIFHEVSNEWMNHAFKVCKTGINKKDFKKGISWLYKDILKMPKPAIIYCDSWSECIDKIAGMREGKKESTWVRYFNFKVTTRISDIGNSLSHILTPALSKILTQPIGNNAKKIMNFISRHMEKDITQAVGWQAMIRVLRFSSGNRFVIFTEYCTDLSWSNYQWVSYYDYLERVGIYNNPHFAKYKMLLRSGVLNCYVYENCVFAIQPPLYIEVNTRGSLHSVKRAALELRDGSKRYCFNGRNITPWIVERPDSITKEKFIREEDVNCRAAMYEILGPKKIMTLLGAKEIARKKNKCRKPSASNLEVTLTGKIISGGVTYIDSEEEYILYESDFNDPQFGILKWVRVICPSNATNYLLSVPPSASDPIEAVARTFGVFPENYVLNQTS